MKTNNLQKELSMSLLSDAELEESIDNLETVFNVKLNTNKIKILRKYILAEDPRQIYSQYSDTLLDVINSLENNMQSFSLHNNAVLGKYLRGNSLKPLLANIQFVDKYGTVASSPDWEEEINAVDNEIFHNFINDANQSIEALTNLKGRVINLRCVNANGFYRKEKPLTDRGNYDFLFPDRSMIFGYNGGSTNTMENFFSGAKEIQYSKSYSVGGGRRIFIFLNLLKMRDVSQFNTTLKTLESISAQVAKGKDFNLDRLRKINELIQADLNDMAFIYDAGFSLSKPEKEKQPENFFAFLVDGTENTRLQPIEDVNRKWISTFSPLVIKQDSNLFYSGSENITSYRNEALRVIRELEKIISGDKTRTGNGNLNFNNYGYFKTALGNMAKVLKNNMQNFPLLPLKDKNNSERRQGFSSLTNLLYISKFVNVKKEITEINKLFSLEPQNDPPKCSGLFEFFTLNNNDQIPF